MPAGPAIGTQGETFALPEDMSSARTIPADIERTSSPLPVPRDIDPELEWHRKGPLLNASDPDWSKLEFEKPVAQGTWGSVYQYRIGPDTRIAVKILKDVQEDDGSPRAPEFELTREFLINEYIHKEFGPHPNICGVYGLARIAVSGSTEKPLAMLMEAVEGPDCLKLADELRMQWNRGLLSSTEYFGIWQFIGRRAFGVLEHFREKGIGHDDKVNIATDTGSVPISRRVLKGMAHNDLKLENIVVGKDGEPKVVDFGLAANRGQRQACTEYTDSEDDKRSLGNTELSDVFSVAALIASGIQGQDQVYGTDPKGPREYTKAGLAPAVVKMLDAKGKPEAYPANLMGSDFSRSINKLLRTDPLERLDASKAKKLAFFKDSMLNDDEAKAALRSVIERMRPGQRMQPPRPASKAPTPPTETEQVDNIDKTGLRGQHEQHRKTSIASRCIALLKESEWMDGIDLRVENRPRINALSELKITVVADRDTGIRRERHRREASEHEKIHRENEAVVHALCRSIPEGWTREKMDEYAEMASALLEEALLASDDISDELLDQLSIVSDRAIRLAELNGEILRNTISQPDPLALRTGKPEGAIQPSDVHESSTAHFEQGQSRPAD
ncbi:protein kinase domain-containing protein [Noviherbaspirillum aerium]|uniref:protein kinase domain-containing protein n=1 Tax=Noviherbaspirillum aerium TaxID=2588497 RepID=UPI00178C7638|nr:protein kinase [Noviherbaspirillum aerium]